MKIKPTRKTITAVIAAIALYLLIALLILTGILPRSMQSLVVKISYYVILALSLNLIVGFLGDLSLGHAAFYATGAYAGCAFALHSGLPLIPNFLLSLVIGGLCAALVGFLISCAILKLRGDYLAIVTLAFGEFIRSIVKIIPGLGGTKGLTGIPSFSRFEGFTFGYIAVLLVILILCNFTDSRHGRTITAIRDNAIAAESVGINIKRYKILVFTLSSFMAGMAGVLFGFYKTSVEPADFTYNVSIEILVMVVLGGMGSLKGSVIAAVIIVALPELLREAAAYRMLIYAIALITMMMLNSSPKFTALKESALDHLTSLRGAVTARLKRTK